MNIKEVAKLAGISVRTLHHYDKIGLLVPTRNVWNDYRDYSDDDLDKLQQICFFKACGFPLTEIQHLLESSNFDKNQAFELQRNYLLHEKDRITTLLDTLERSMQDMKGSLTMTQAEKFKGFDFTKENPYEKEAIKRFGTKAVAQTKEKIDNLSNDGKQKISDQMNQLFHDLENLKDENPAATIAQAAIANMYHTFNDTLGYHYTLEAFAGLGQLYVQDERFTENLRQYGDGFPEFLAAAMTYYAQKT